MSTKPLNSSPEKLVALKQIMITKSPSKLKELPSWRSLTEAPSSDSEPGSETPAISVPRVKKSVHFVHDLYPSPAPTSASSVSHSATPPLDSQPLDRAQKLGALGSAPPGPHFAKSALVKRQTRHSAPTFTVDELLGTVKAQLSFENNKIGGSQVVHLMNTRFIRHHIQSTAPQDNKMVEEVCSTEGFVQRFQSWFGPENVARDEPEKDVNEIANLGKRKRTDEDEVSVDTATEWARALHKLIKGKVNPTAEELSFVDQVFSRLEDERVLMKTLQISGVYERVVQLSTIEQDEFGERARRLVGSWMARQKLM